MLYRCITQDSVLQNEFEKTLQHMAPARKAQVEKITLPDVQRATVCGEWLCKTMLSQQSGIPFEKIILARGKGGKPFAQNLPLHFNISHSGNRVACAVSQNPVGIDLEVFKKRELSVARRVCSPQEMAYIFSNEQDRLARFLEVWTAKEAAVKLSGIGIKAMPQTDFFVLKPRLVLVQTEEYVLSIIE